MKKDRSGDGGEDDDKEEINDKTTGKILNKNSKKSHNKITGKINKTIKDFDKNSGKNFVKIVDNAGGLDIDLKLRAMDGERMERGNGGKTPIPSRFFCGRGGEKISMVLSKVQIIVHKFM